jgi:hypothetical protein
LQETTSGKTPSPLPQGGGWKMSGARPHCGLAPGLSQRIGLLWNAHAALRKKRGVEVLR